ncbi:MAG: ATP-binding cassette domain-containing protein [Lachnospiraceae bacterium]|nr:ATP-binding cassette domain-containing protein [Lachnospiraceae bacterium]
MELLSVENVTFRYPKAASDALSDVSLSVTSGQWAVLCGLSGCGKSTLLRLIKRELAPYGQMKGRILFDGKDTRKTSSPDLSDREAAEGIGIVLQDPEAQIVTDEVWHELAFGLENLGLPSDTIRRRVAEMAAFFGIEDWYHRKTFELSGGQKQLLNLAASMVMNPRLLLLDEPTAQLDPIAAADFRNMLSRVNRDLGVTILMAEHRLEDVMPLADRVFLMRDRGNSVLFGGTPADAARYLYANSHPMAEALPAATQVYFALTGGSIGLGETMPAGDTAIPFTVRDGRAFLSSVTENSDAGNAKPAAARTLDPAPVALEAKDLRFRYAKQAPDVLAGASITLHEGEHYCLLGGNGSGKTTLLSLLAGLTKPYAGSVRLFGRNMNSFKPGELYRGNLALLPQQPRDVFVEKTIREDLEKAFQRVTPSSGKSGDGSDTSAETAGTAMMHMCERLRITDILDSHPYDVSGGELQKAALAKVLASRPKVLLLDEPAKGIDVSGKRELAELLAELRAKGLAVISVTHDAEWAAAHADRCGLLFDGEIISEGVPEAFFADNAFYTTAANRIARGIIDGVIRVDDLIRGYKPAGSGNDGLSRDSLPPDGAEVSR